VAGAPLRPTSCLTPAVGLDGAKPTVEHASERLPAQGEVLWQTATELRMTAQHNRDVGDRKPQSPTHGSRSERLPARDASFIT
jgi:hypothetical protein